MNSYILLVGGPAGSGKTSAAEAWATMQILPTAHLNLDTMRQHLRSGFADPVVAGWNDDTRRQFDLAQDLAVLCAKRYHVEGINVVIDDAMFPGVKRARYERWVEKLGDLPHRLVIILPTVDICLHRNSLRQGNKKLPEELIHRFYQDSQGWLGKRGATIIDNTHLSPEQTAIEIDRVLALSA